MRDVFNGLLFAAVLITSCAASHAQTFYKWTDDRGVVHLADEPPPNAHGVQQVQLPPRPPAQSEPPAGESETAKAAVEEPPTRKASAAGGSAQVILVSHQTIRNGPRAAHVIGEVKNIGDKNADTVEIALSVVDAAQGTPCLNERAAVTPATLPPGETGNFDVDLDNPCLAGETPVDVAPVWK